MGWLKLLVRKSRSFWQLDGNSRRLLLQAFLLLPAVALSLKFRGLGFTQTALARWFKATQLPLSSEERHLIIVRAIRMVQLAARYCQPWANCLKKSLVLWGLLRRQGIDSELRIGVKREAGNFEAHAWVEWEGIVLNDTQDVRERFAMFERPIEASAKGKGEA
jgi:hypothetical protein